MAFPYQRWQKFGSPEEEATAFSLTSFLVSQGRRANGGERIPKAAFQAWLMKNISLPLSFQSWAGFGLAVGCWVCYRVDRRICWRLGIRTSASVIYFSWKMCLAVDRFLSNLMLTSCQRQGSPQGQQTALKVNKHSQLFSSLGLYSSDLWAQSKYTVYQTWETCLVTVPAVTV